MLNFLRYLLLPFTAIYSFLLLVRNVLFDIGVFRSQTAVVPTIVIGNLSTGGTGKTPHTEFIARLLTPCTSLAILSRGYGRTTKGFVLINEHATASLVGDEPMQIHKKFPDIPFAVCEDRWLGISELKKLFPSIQVVLLDDAFQHRSLKPDLSILLTDYNQPYWNDIVLPTGNLRDNVREVHRADIVMVTKCPPNLSQEEKSEILGTIYPQNHQRVFYSSIRYGQPIHFSGPVVDFDTKQGIVAVCGIASPAAFMAYLEEHFEVKKSFIFRDHHIFSHSDLREINGASGNFTSGNWPVVTTEKDAMRLLNIGLEPTVPMYFIPIEVSILDHEEQFKEAILSQVSRLTRADNEQ